MVSSGKARFFKRKDGKYWKYLLYLPVDFAEDSMFPFPIKKEISIDVKVSIKCEENILTVEK